MFIPLWKILDYVVSFLALYVVILFMLIYFDNQEKMLSYPKSTTWEPKISVVIPAYNEEKNIGKCIQSLLDVDYPKNKLEIIVVDDESKDNTYNEALKYRKNGVKVFTKKNQGTAAATKNYGINKATGEVIATLDADSFVSKQVIRKMLPLFEDESIVAVTSAVKVAESKTFLQKLQKVEYLATLFARRATSFVDSVVVTPGPFSMFRAWALKELKGFDEKSILEDQEIALRMQKNNWKIRSSIDASVYTEVPGGFFSLIRQRIRWHRGGLLNSVKYFHLINPKYGDFGMAIMPLSLMAIFAVFAVLFNVAFKLLFHFEVSDFLFADNIWLIFQPVHFVGIVIFILTLGFTIYQLSFFKDEKVHPLWALVYIFSYAYLITIYWILAILKQIKGDDITW